MMIAPEDLQEDLYRIVSFNQDIRVDQGKAARLEIARAATAGLALIEQGKKAGNEFLAGKDGLCEALALK